MTTKLFDLDLSHLPPIGWESTRLLIGKVIGEGANLLTLARAAGITQYAWWEDSDNIEVFAEIPDPDQGPTATLQLIFGIGIDEGNNVLYTMHTAASSEFDGTEYDVFVPDALKPALVEAAFPIYQEFRNFLTTL